MDKNIYSFNNTARINKTDIPYILESLSQTLNVNYSYLMNNLLGSAFKRDTSGDLDIGISYEMMSFDAFVEFVTEKYFRFHPKLKVKVNKAFRQIYTLYPYLNREEMIQIDYMYGNLDWMRFSFRAPEFLANPYDALYRNFLLQTLCLINTSQEAHEAGQLVAKTGLIFDLNFGIRTETRFRPYLSNKKERQVKFIKVSDENIDLFRLEFPQLILAPSAKIINVPNEALEFLFKIPMDPRSNFEDLMFVAQTQYRDSLEKIKEIFIKKCTVQNVPVPNLFL